MRLPLVAIRRQRGELRLSLVTSFFLLLLLFAVLDALLIRRALLGLEERVGRRVLQLEVGEVRESLERLWETAEFALRETADHRDDLAAGRFRDVNIRLMTLMKMHHVISSVNYGDAAGNGFLLLREGQRWRNRIKHEGLPPADPAADREGARFRRRRLATATGGRQAGRDRCSLQRRIHDGHRAERALRRPREGSGALQPAPRRGAGRHLRRGP